MASGTITERTAVRSAPSGDVILAQLPAGTKITFAITIGGWLQLFTVDGVQRAGYVNARSVKIDTVIVGPPPVDPPPVVPPVVPVSAVHVIRTNATGQISIDGLSYE